MKYRHYLFDLDGTLTDPREGITRCVQHALKHFGIIVEDRSLLYPFIGPPLVPSFMEFYNLTKEQAEEALAVYRSRFSTVGWSENEVLEGVPEMLSSLQSQGKKLYVASSKPEIYVLRILEHFGLKDFFSIITGGDMEGKRTEKADVIREVMRRGGFEHEELKSMLMVGDRKHDIIGAKLCGIDSAGVYTGFAGENELEEAGADYVCFGIGELSKLLISF